MLKKLKKFTLQMIAGANVATIIIMIMVGLSDRLSPAVHPYLACIGLSFPFFMLVNIAFLVFWVFFHFRYIWIPILGFALCFGAVRTYLPINIGTPDPPAGALKILSYNVQGYRQDTTEVDGKQHIRFTVVEYVRDCNADIVCLQEANQAWNNGDTIKAMLSVYPYSETVMMDKGNKVSLLSKYPIVSSERIKYESKNNGSAAFRIKIGEDTVTVINNHFENSHLEMEDRAQYKEIIKGDMDREVARGESKKLLGLLAEAAAVRSRQVDAVAEYIGKHKGESMILCGDFNDNPISYTHHRLASLLNDCFVATGNGIGISYNKIGFPVRIDNIMCSDDWQPYKCHIDSKISTSDHYPMLCWLKKQ